MMDIFGMADMFLGGVIVLAISCAVLWGIFSWVFDKWIFSAISREAAWKIVLEARKKRDKQAGDSK